MEPHPLSLAELAYLERAAEYLEHPSLLLRAGTLALRPVEAVARVLPLARRQLLARAGASALRGALDLAVRSLGDGAARSGTVDAVEHAGRWVRRRHRAAAVVTGAGGGLFGWAGLIVELPITTSIMLRSIAAIARDFGEDLREPAARLECLTVLGYDGRRASGDALESSYLSTRLALTEATQAAATFVAQVGATQARRAIARGQAPALVRLLGAIAQRFEVAVGEKILVEGVPMLGAAGGALVNAGFIAHFDRVARFHFGIRRLERTHGEDLVRSLYRRAIERAGGAKATQREIAGSAGAVAPPELLLVAPAAPPSPPSLVNRTV